MRAQKGKAFSTSRYRKPDIVSTRRARLSELVRETLEQLRAAAIRLSAFRIDCPPSQVDRMCSMYCSSDITFDGAYVVRARKRVPFTIHEACIYVRMYVHIAPYMSRALCICGELHPLTDTDTIATTDTRWKKRAIRGTLVITPAENHKTQKLSRRDVRKLKF